MLYPANGTILAFNALWISIRAISFMDDKFCQIYLIQPDNEVNCEDLLRIYTEG